MKKLLTILVSITLLVSFGGCSKQTSSTLLTAQDIALKLKEAKLPIDNIIVYTEETDKNKLLGRPGQYISKANFADTWLEQTDTDRPKGGSIEVFNTQKDLNKRKAYIESVAESLPGLTEYLIVNGNYLLRLDKGLTPTQVKVYTDVFMKIN